MRWAALLGHYAWGIAVREALRSSRWTPEERMGAILMLGVLISGPVVVAAVVWLLTGRGPYRWLGGTYAVVNPFPRALPPDIVAVLNRRSS